MKQLVTTSSRAIYAFSVATLLCFGSFASEDLTDSDVKEQHLTFYEQMSEIAKIEHERIGGALHALKERSDTPIGSFTFTNTPPMISGRLPFRFTPFDGITVDLVMTDPTAARGLTSGDYHSLISTFNIQIMTSNSDLAWPTEAQAVMKLEKSGVEIEVRSSLKLDGMRYSFDDPFETLQAVMGAVHELDRTNPNNKRRARLDIKYLTGFDKVASQAKDLTFPVGIPVTYSLNLGNLRLDSNYMWLGRAPEITSVMPQLEFFK